MSACGVQTWVMYGNVMYSLKLFFHLVWLDIVESVGQNGTRLWKASTVKIKGNLGTYCTGAMGGGVPPVDGL